MLVPPHKHAPTQTRSGNNFDEFRKLFRVFLRPVPCVHDIQCTTILRRVVRIRSNHQHRKYFRLPRSGVHAITVLRCVFALSGLKSTQIHIDAATGLHVTEVSFCRYIAISFRSAHFHKFHEATRTRGRMYWLNVRSHLSTNPYRCIW